MNIFKCRCLSHRFIFIHFTNTEKKLVGFAIEGCLIDWIRRSQFLSALHFTHYRKLDDFLRSVGTGRDPAKDIGRL